MEIIKQTSNLKLTRNPDRKIEYIVIHYTAGVTSKKGSAKNTAHYFATSKVKASADYIVDEEEVVQYNPDPKNYNSWHCGDEKANTKGGSLYGICTNANSIGIELCSKNLTGKITYPNDPNYLIDFHVINNAV